MRNCSEWFKAFRDRKGEWSWRRERIVFWSSPDSCEWVSAFVSRVSSNGDKWRGSGILHTCNSSATGNAKPPQHTSSPKNIKHAESILKTISKNSIPTTLYCTQEPCLLTFDMGIFYNTLTVKCPIKVQKYFCGQSIAMFPLQFSSKCCIIIYNFKWSVFPLSDVMQLKLGFLLLWQFLFSL